MQDSLISISKASQFLGVSEAALRQWTDEGKIKAFITPGGHRRFSKSELKKFTTSSRKVLGIRDLVVELEDTVKLHREISKKSLNTTLQYNKVAAESQEHLAHLGRLLLNLIIQYVTEPSKREQTAKLARDVGHDHGETLARLGLPLTDAVEAFLVHRDPIINATTHLLRKREAFTGRIVEAIPLVAHIMDEAMVSLVTAHQQHRDKLQNGSKEGAAT